MVWVPCAALRGNLRCSTKAGSRSNSASPQTIASPDPLLPVLLGPARRVGEANADAGRQGRALRGLAGVRLRIRSRSRPHHPSVCAEERRSRRTRASDCLSEASSSSTPAGPSTAGCPKRSEGTQTAGSPFLCLLSFGDAKESELPPGNPGLLADRRRRGPYAMHSDYPCFTPASPAPFKIGFFIDSAVNFHSLQQNAVLQID